MPYPREIASGESLIWLENSEALKEFEGVILQKEGHAQIQPPIINVARSDWYPRRVIAIDGSNIVHRVNNGFPGAEAGLLMISVVAVKLRLLEEIKETEILRPSFFRDMEQVHTLESAMPGIGIVRKGVDDDTPYNFFRQSVFDTLSNSIALNHESLLETLRSMCRNSNFETRIECPAMDCKNKFDLKDGQYFCECDRHEKLFETDLLRLHEYFDDVQSSGEALGRLRSVLEILVLINILRFFAKNAPAYLESCAFVLDGPLAIFGTPASILTPIRVELKRLNEIARSNNGEDLVVFGIEKSGRMKEHLEQLDYEDDAGPRSRFGEKTIIVPNNDYIRANVVPSNYNSKPFGADTHFGRYVLYKTNRGKHVVVNTAMLNDVAAKLDSNSTECYPRLGDILDVVDRLATYIYADGFLPIVRAHAHAAIPLKRGTDIIKSLLEDG